MSFNAQLIEQSLRKPALKELKAVVGGAVTLLSLLGSMLWLVFVQYFF
jgi:hypothetical protein